MGAWNARLFSNDTTCDIKDTYKEFLIQQLSDEDAYKKTYEEYSELMGTDEEPLFWYALADTQWRVGRLMPEVKEKALKFICENGGIDEWEEIPNGSEKWKATLKKLKDTITSDMPPRKKFPKPIEFISNPWNVGDVYAYQFHTDEAVKNNFYGKYILMQKIGNVEKYRSEIYSVVKFFDKLFETIPNVDEIKNIRVLPLSPSPTPTHPIEEYIPSFESCLQASLEMLRKKDYPQKHLFFLGNVPISEEKYKSNEIDDFYWHKHGMEEWLIPFYLSWQGVNY